MAGRNGASDQRGRLVSDPFDYRIAKDGAVVVSRGGRPVTTVGGRDAGRLAAVLQRADDVTTQHVLARITGDYKRGNERG